MSADFIPSRNTYKTLGSFRFWCQKVLPQVYDDSLSYYELLNKVVDYLNEVNENADGLNDDVTAMYTAFKQLQDYVNDWFSDLNVQEQVNNKIQSMVDSGEFEEIVDAFLQPLFDNYSETTDATINAAITRQDTSISEAISAQNTEIDNATTRLNDRLTQAVTSQNTLIGQNTNAIDVLESRVDAITSLPSGSTSGDAELTDIRVAYTGATYASAGDAVRAQAENNHNGVVRLNDLIGDDYTVGSDIIATGLQTGYKISNVGVAVAAASAKIDSYPVVAGSVISVELYADFEDCTYIFQNTEAVTTTVPNMNIIGGTIGGIFKGDINGFIKVPEGATYLCVSSNTANDVNSVKSCTRDVEEIETKQNALKNIQADISSMLNYNNTTHKGVTFTFSDNIVRVTGTPSANAFTNLYYSTSKLPFWIKPNDVLSIAYNWNGRVFIQVAFHDGTGWSATTTVTYKNNTIKVPQNALGMYIRLMVYASGGAVDETDKLPVITKLASPDTYIGYDLYDFTTKTINGISYSWDYNKNVCKLSGTASSNSYNVLYDSGDTFPSELRQGEEINCSFYTRDTHIRASLVFYDKESVVLLEKVIGTPVSIIIPEATSRLVVRLVVYNGYSVDNTCTAPLIINGKYKQLFMPTSYNRRKLVSFIDDDANGNEYVRKYYQACKHNGIVGSYAVITGGYANGTLDIQQLRNIQKDGFNMIIHCEEQETYLRPRNDNYDNARARGNYIQAILDFKNLGLINPQGMWCIPYGDTEDAVLTIGMDMGFDMFFGIVGSTYNRVTDIDKHKLYRCGLVSLSEVSDDTATTGGTLARAKLRIDELMADNESGWLIIMTHFNTWQNETWNQTLDSNGYEIGYARFNEVVQYAKNAGCEIVSMAEGAAYMKPFYDKNAAK